MGEETIWKPPAAGAYTGLSVGALAQMRYRGIGPKFIKLGKKSVRYRKSDIDAWLSANTMQCTSERATA